MASCRSPSSSITSSIGPTRSTRQCPWGPRRIGGRDIVWWAAQSGFLDRTPATLPGPAARLVGNIVTTGHGGGHDLHLRTLEQMGVELLGRFRGAEANKIGFADD